jgi:hypothetical protein
LGSLRARKVIFMVFASLPHYIVPATWQRLTKYWLISTIIKITSSITSAFKNIVGGEQEGTIGPVWGLAPVGGGRYKERV